MKIYTPLLCLLLIWPVSPLQATNACTSHIQRVERLEGIPRNLLAAMAQVESGRYNKSTKVVEPWPWTVQSQGKSNYFSTRSEAVNHVKSLQRQGIKNIDIGCMQMNLEHHGHKFSTIEQMFDPANNVGQGAKYLKQLKSDKNKAWSTAVGNYHSFTPVHHMRYKNLVLKKLSQVNREQGGAFVDHGIVDEPRYNDRPATRGSLYPGGTSKLPRANPVVHSVSASLYSYSRTHGMTGARQPVHKQTHKVIKMTAKSRMASMKASGVKDMAYMDTKKLD